MPTCEDERVSAIEEAMIEAVRAGDDEALDAARRAWIEAHGHEARLPALLDDARWEARVAAVATSRALNRIEPLARACLLVGRMQREDDARVREAIVSAFVDLKQGLGGALTFAFVSRFARDADAAMRRAVAAALGGDRSEQAIALLSSMTRDEDDGVRDWACFAIGHLLGLASVEEGIVDTDEIREALADRLDDENEEVREEAATGLALRGDARGVERVMALLERFDEEGVTTRVLMTAVEAPDPRWVPALEAIVAERPDLRDAVSALEACRARKPRPFCGAPRHAGCDCFRRF